MTSRQENEGTWNHDPDVSNIYTSPTDRGIRYNSLFLQLLLLTLIHLIITNLHNHSLIINYSNQLRKNYQNISHFPFACFNFTIEILTAKTSIRPSVYISIHPYVRGASV